MLAENDTTASIKGSDLVKQKLDHGKTWEGPLSCRRKAGDNLVLETRIIPVSFSAKRLPDNLIYVRLPLPHQYSLESSHEATQPPPPPTSSAASTGRRSSKSSAGSKDVPNIPLEGGPGKYIFKSVMEIRK